MKHRMDRKPKEGEKEDIAERYEDYEDEHFNQREKERDRW